MPSTIRTSPSGYSSPYERIVVTSNRVVLNGSQNAAPATLEISQASGKFVAIQPGKASGTDYPSDTQFFDYGDLVIMPGLVDSHVHIDEPGRTAWEGFETATKAAAAGGVTTLVDMPLNSLPPTTTVENLFVKVKAAKDQSYVDVGFYGGVIPGNAEHLVPLHKAGVKGFKCFMIESGVDEFPCVDLNDITKALEVLKTVPTCFMFHAEMDPEPETPQEERLLSPIDDHDLHHPFSAGLRPGSCLNLLEKLRLPPLRADHYSTFLHSRPQLLELFAIENILRLAHLAPSLNLHIVHLSASKAIPILRQARKAGVNITAETCFHYLTLEAEAVGDGQTQFKCCPPIREADNQEFLWEGLFEGDIGTVVSDHSPCTPDLKRMAEGDFIGAWGGIATIGLGLPVLWTEGKTRGIKFQDLIRWMSEGTAKQVGMYGRKGVIQVGAEADLCIWSPEETFTVAVDHMHFKNKMTPYEGCKLYGVVHQTWLRGRVIWDIKNGGHQGPPSGVMLLDEREP